MTERITAERHLRFIAESAYSLARSEVFDAPGFRPGDVLRRDQAAIVNALLEADAALDAFRSEARDRMRAPVAQSDSIPGWLSPVGRLDVGIPSDTHEPVPGLPEQDGST